MDKIEAVIFDLDGTLIDSMGIWVKVDLEFMKKKNIPFTPDLFEEVPEGNSFQELAVFIKEKFNLTESVQSICQEWTDMVQDHYENQIELKPGVTELLQFLHQNKVKMAIGTSNSFLLTEAVLQNNNVRHFFDVIISGDQDVRGKPYPDIFLKAAQELNVQPKNCIVLEDTLAGAKSAYNAGMKLIMVKDENSVHEWDDIEKIAIFSEKEIFEINKFLKNLMRC